MSAPSTLDPIILTGTTGSGNRYLQLWTEAHRIAGHTVAHCHAEMNSLPEYGRPQLSITSICPNEWADLALALFPRFRAGETIAATHTVEWQFGKPTFTAVNS